LIQFQIVTSANEYKYLFFGRHFFNINYVAIELLGEGNIINSTFLFKRYIRKQLKSTPIYFYANAEPKK